MAVRKDVLVDQDKMYALTIDEAGALYLEVMCGGFAMENVSVKLNADEVSHYHASGKDCLDEIAMRIRHHRDQYVDRIVI